MKKFLLLYLFCFPLLSYSQPCTTDSAGVLGNPVDVSMVFDSVPCLPNECGFDSCARVAIPDLDGYIYITGVCTSPAWIQLWLDCDTISLDTCVQLACDPINPTGTFTIVGNYPPTAFVRVCASYTADIRVWFKPMTVFNIHSPLIAIDTLCPPLAIDRPRFVAYTDGYTDMIGRYWLTLDNQPSGLYYSWESRKKVRYLKP